MRRSNGQQTPLLGEHKAGTQRNQAHSIEQDPILSQKVRAHAIECVTRGVSTMGPLVAYVLPYGLPLLHYITTHLLKCGLENKDNG